MKQEDWGTKALCGTLLSVFAKSGVCTFVHLGSALCMFAETIETNLGAGHLYADLADSYGIISTIDSDLFATHQGRDRTAWERVLTTGVSS